MTRLFSIATMLLALVALGVPSLSLGMGIGVAAPVVVSADTVADAPDLVRSGHCKSLGGKRVLPCHPDLGVMAGQVAAIAPASSSSPWRAALPVLPAVAPEAELPPPRLA
jgi:hypothetical protein